MYDVRNLKHCVNPSAVLRSTYEATVLQTNV